MASMGEGDRPLPRRPTMPGERTFQALPDDDPAERAEAAHRSAEMLVRGARAAGDAYVVRRVVHLADDQGLDLLAELWSDSPADSLPGALWRLYLLRTWVHADPRGIAREFDDGRRHAPVQEVVAGVVEPPGPDEVRVLADTVLQGVTQGDFATTLDRAAAFCRIVAVGRAHSSDLATTEPAARLMSLADQLESAARSERAGTLG